MTVTFDIGYEDGVDLTSYVSVRRARYNYDLVDRRTETAGLNRSAYGGRQAATSHQAATATAKNDLLKCSECELEKHFELFPADRRYWHRHGGRSYLCAECKHLRYEEAKAEAMREALEEKQSEKRLSKKEKKAAKRKLEKQPARVT